jgi:hypothetical protein
MKAIHVLSLLVMLFCAKSHAQQDYFNFKPIKIKEAIVLENKQHSKRYTHRHKTVYANERGGLAQPEGFVRQQSNDFPRATVDYYYSENDSVVKRISYFWDVNEDADAVKNIANYNIEFDKIVKLISKHIGEPAPNQGVITHENETLIGDGTTIRNERRVQWQYKGCQIITLLVWADQHGQSFSTAIYWD